MTAVTVTGARRGRLRLDLAVELVRRDLRLRYRRSVLGALWSQAGPLVTLAVIAFVFTRVVPLGVEDYVTFALVGLLAWNWWSSGLVSAAESIVGGRDLVRQPGFAPELLPPVAVASHLAQFVLAFPVLLVAATIDTGAPGWSLLALPAVLAVQFVLALGPAYVLAAVNVRFRDVSHVVGVAMLPLFWASPVFYPASAVPEAYLDLYRLNPLVHVLEGYRAVLLHHRWPDPTALAIVASVGVLATLAGRAYHRRASARFVEELGS